MILRWIKNNHRPYQIFVSTPNEFLDATRRVPTSKISMVTHRSGRISEVAQGGTEKVSRYKGYKVRLRRDSPIGRGNPNEPQNPRKQQTKSEIPKRGWRTEGVGARKSILCHSLRPLSAPFFLFPPTVRRGTHPWGTFLLLILGPVSRQPPPANPSSEPWHLRAGFDLFACFCSSAGLAS